MHLQTKIAPYWKRRLAVQSSPRPIISFTFDDFPRSAVSAGGKILSQFGIRGTYYASMGLAGTQTAVGEIFHASDIDQLMADGHELGCHTLNHTRSCDTTAAGLLVSCADNREKIAQLCGGLKPSSFSFPEGVVTLGGKAALGATYSSCRSIEPGLNDDPVDMAFLRANRLYSRWGTSELKKAIARNKELRAWLIVYTHDVTEQPSLYGCTPAEFGEIVQCALESGADVLPVREAHMRFSPVSSKAA